MEGDNFTNAKGALLSHIETLFEEIEQESVMSHQEKFALLEDALNSATDVDELHVAFDQWYSEHAEDIGFDYQAHEIWWHALAEDVESYDIGCVEDDDEEEPEEEPEEEFEEDDIL